MIRAMIITVQAVIIVALVILCLYLSTNRPTAAEPALVTVPAVSIQPTSCEVAIAGAQGYMEGLAHRLPSAGDPAESTALLIVQLREACLGHR